LKDTSLKLLARQMKKLHMIKVLEPITSCRQTAESHHKHPCQHRHNLSNPQFIQLLWRVNTLLISPSRLREIPRRITSHIRPTMCIFSSRTHTHTRSRSRSPNIMSMGKLRRIHLVNHQPQQVILCNGH
jgi:hypothetical protein